MKKFLFALCSFALALSFAACSSDDGEENGGNSENGGNNGNSKDYIATTQKKTIKIDVNSGSLYTIYEDYFYRHKLQAHNGDILLKTYFRSDNSYVNNINMNKEVGGIGAFEHIDDLQDLTLDLVPEAKSKSFYHNYIYSESNQYHYAYADFSPGCGFIVWFTTENDEELYVRMRSTGYTLDNEGTLKSITLEYQLF